METGYSARSRDCAPNLRQLQRGPLVQVDRMEMTDPVSVDLLVHRVSFLEGAAAGGF